MHQAQCKQDVVVCHDNLTIKEKLERRIYIIDFAPRIMSMDGLDVRISELAPYPDEEEAYSRGVRGGADKWIVPVPTNKLKARSYSDWYLEIRKTNKKHFDNKEKFDDLAFRIFDKCYDRSECKIYERISMRNALKLINVKLTCNMDYYLKNRKEIESDIGHKLTSLEFYYEDDALKKLEDELFYKLMCKLFGEPLDDDNIKPEDDDSTYEKTYMLRDFCVLPIDGDGSIMATAMRGDYYIRFLYEQ